MNERTCQAAVGNQRHIQINGSTTNLITIRQLMRRQILGDIHHHIYPMLMQQVKGCRNISILLFI